MKLKEVVDISNFRTSPQNFKTVTDKMNMAANRIGSGAYADVFSIDKGPVEKVLKVGKTYATNPKKEGYLAYLANLIQGNPFFPQIDKIVIRKSTHPTTPSEYDVYDREDTGPEEFHYYVKQERLFPADSLSDRETDWLLKKYFNIDPEMHKRDVERGIQAYKRVGLRTDARAKAEIFANLASDAIMGRDKLSLDLEDAAGNEIVFDNAYPKTPEFKEAIKILRKMYADDMFPLDLHGNNIMYRRTPYGVQPVIIDPFLEKA